MPTIGPYQLLHALGTCQVGDVWSAVDANNNHVTLAVLKPETASDPALRDAFATAANGLAQSRQIPVIAGDFSTATPWIASSASDGSVVAQVFVALGMAYQPLVPPDPPQPAAPAWADNTQVVNLQPGPASSAPVSGAGLASPGSPGGSAEAPSGLGPQSPAPAAGQASPPAAGPQPPPAQPVSVPPGPVSVPPGPASAPPLPMPGWAPPVSDSPPQDFTPIAVLPEDGQRRRTGLLIGALVLGILVLAGSGGAIAFVLQPDDDPPPPPTDPVASASVAAPSLPAPSQPGIEPPLRERWPDVFAGFGADDPRTEMAGLPGLTFNFDVPVGWDCVDQSAGDGIVRYICGPDGNSDEIGGELIVSPCPDPCDADTRQELRMAEEAWGRQWHGDGDYRAWIERDLDGGRYGLLFIGYTRSEFDGRVDTKVVLRLAGPVEDKSTIQKVASSVRYEIRLALAEQ